MSGVIVTKEPESKPVAGTGEGFRLVQKSNGDVRLIFTDEKGHKKSAGNVLTIKQGEDGYYINRHSYVRGGSGEFDTERYGVVRTE